MAISKGEIMELVYGENYTNIDSAIPQPLWDKINTRIHVVNYNKDHGTLENIIKEAMKKGIELPQNIIDEEYRNCKNSDEYFYNNYCRKSGEDWYSHEVFMRYKLTVTNFRRPMTPEQQFDK